MSKKNRAFLKWAGGKYGLSDVIAKMLPKGDCLIEPFVGAGSVFLNTDYSRYVLNDINKDLINLYQILQVKPDTFIHDARKFFSAENNESDTYYQLRKEFNESKDRYFRSLIFLYMNLDIESIKFMSSNIIKAGCELQGQSSLKGKV